MRHVATRDTPGCVLVPSKPLQTSPAGSMRRFTHARAAARTRKYHIITGHGFYVRVEADKCVLADSAGGLSPDQPTWSCCLVPSCGAPPGSRPLQAVQSPLVLASVLHAASKINRATPGSCKQRARRGLTDASRTDPALSQPARFYTHHRVNRRAFRRGRQGLELRSCRAVRLGRWRDD